MFTPDADTFINNIKMYLYREVDEKNVVEYVDTFSIPNNRTSIMVKCLML